MDLEWDERKRRANLAKHGIDFEAARQIFEGRFIEREDRRPGYGEQRMLAYGEIDGIVLCVVYTRRGQRRRIISIKGRGEMSAKSTTRPRRAAAPRDRTDWSRVGNMTEEEIEANAASDSDNPAQEEGLMREGRTVWPESPRWELIQLHLGADVLEWFRARRFLYQDEINEALRAYMDARRDED